MTHHPDAIQWQDFEVIGGDLNRNSAGQIELRIAVQRAGELFTLAGVLDDAAGLTWLPTEPPFVVDRFEEP